MAKFFSRCNRPSCIPCSTGSFERPIFEERVVDGVKKLVKTGKENIKDFIEASKAETLISNIMRRFEMGDVNVLSRTQGFYGDVTGMPSSLAEAQNILIKLRNQFDSFPVDVKRQFDNSFDKYVREVSFSNVEDFSKTFGLKSAPDKLSSGMVSESEVE